MAGIVLSTAHMGQGLMWLSLIFALMGTLGKKSVRFFFSASFFCTLSAFSLLVVAHLTSDFSYLNVVLNSHTHEPFVYKLAGVWGSHEGSFLLWCVFFTLYTFIFVWQKGGGTAQKIMGYLQCSFILLLLLACDPFVVMGSIPANGLDLNPVLQDLSLLYHPPCLYAGLVGCAVPFSMCLESLILKRPLAPNLVAPWVRAAWTFLTGGLLLGSYWAYYELGWGGFWFWDPVENAALMPWLVMTAFLHTLFNPFQARASLGLGVLAFCLCVCILFFVRSGVLVSVHSFAVDANRGLLFFILTLSVIVPSLMIFSKNIRCVPKPTVAKTLQFFMFQTQLVLLMVGVFILFLAMLIPIIMGYFGNPFSLGPSYFQATFLPMLMPLLFFMVFSPFLGSLSSLLRQPVPLVMLLVSFILSQITLHYYPLSFLAFLGFWFALSILGASIFSKQKLKRLSMHMAHGGVALVLVGAILGTFGEEKITFSLENSPIYFCGYTLTCQSPLSCHGPNYTAQQFPILVTKEKKTFGYLGPEIRHYPTQEATHHESSLLNQGPSQLYAVCSMDDSGKVYIQVLYKPYINFLWVGGLLLMVSGIFSWFGQSLRQSRFFFRRHTSC